MTHTRLCRMTNGGFYGDCDCVEFHRHTFYIKHVRFREDRRRPRRKVR